MLTLWCENRRNRGGNKMSHAQRCPVCNGSGKVLQEPDTTSNMRITCYGCGGKGWVEVSD